MLQVLLARLPGRSGYLRPVRLQWMLSVWQLRLAGGPAVVVPGPVPADGLVFLEKGALALLIMSHLTQPLTG